jgi:hypothetical protein
MYIKKWKNSKQNQFFFCQVMKFCPKNSLNIMYVYVHDIVQLGLYKG